MIGLEMKHEATKYEVALLSALLLAPFKQIKDSKFVKSLQEQVWSVNFTSYFFMIGLEMKHEATKYEVALLSALLLAPFKQIKVTCVVLCTAQ